MKVTFKLVNELCSFEHFVEGKQDQVYDCEILDGEKNTKQIARFNACPYHISMIVKGFKGTL